MIFCIFGTTGEFIKLAPVLTRLRARGTPLMTLCTAQQARKIRSPLAEFGIDEPLWLGNGFRGSDLTRARQIPEWAATVASRFLRQYPMLRRAATNAGGRSLVLVHGDTFTTVLGSMMGRALRVPVAHVEAGLRSFDLIRPFPEEVNRRLCSRLVRVHFAPGPGPVRNLHKAPGVVVNTHTNTVRDALDMVPQSAEAPFPVPERYGIISLRRFELLKNRRELEKILRCLHDRARTTPLLFVNHPVTAAKLDQYGLRDLFDSERFILIPKVGYFSFVTILRGSAFVVTDTGGLQEECYYLDRPCLVHRRVPDRDVGLGRNAVLSRLDLSITGSFLDRPDQYRSGSKPDGPSPSDIIVDFLAREGYCGA